MSLWLVGSGAMSKDYAKVLDDLQIQYEVIGRGETSSEKFEKETGKSVIQGGLNHALKLHKAPMQAIVAVGVEMLSGIAKELLLAGTKYILLEKPGGISTAEIEEVNHLANTQKATVLLAYNRRFYASTQAVRQLIFEDGGATSCSFEFTEWSHIIGSLKKNENVKKSWFLANSSHVVDLAFFLCGSPKEWKGYKSGSLDWHQSASRFCGSGITDQGVLFNYHADWEAPGRWGLEVLTKKNRYILRPIEQLQKISLGKIVSEAVSIDDQIDKDYKPGLYKQVKSFIDKNNKDFCTLEEQLVHCLVYDEIAGYRI